MAGNTFSVKATFDGQELVQGFKDVKKEVADLTTEGQKAGKSLGEMLGQKNATSNYARQLSQLKQELTDLSVNYSKLTAAERESDFGKNMAAQIETLRTKAIDLKTVMDDVATSLKGSTAEMGESIQDFGQQWSAVQRQTEQTRAKFESIQKVSAGVASGFAAIQGAAALLGGENENLQRTLIKVQSAMAIAQGIGGLKDLIEGLSQAKLAFSGVSKQITIFIKGLSGIQVALLKTGIGAFIVLLGVLIANWDTLAEKLGLATKEQTEYEKAVQESIEIENRRKNTVAQSVGSVVAKYTLLQAQWKALRTEQEKNQWIEDNQTAFNNLGIAINNINDANRILIEDSPNVINALKLQAEAAALATVYEEIYADYQRQQLGQLSEGKYKNVQGGQRISEELLQELIDEGVNMMNTESPYYTLSYERASGQFLGGRMNPIWTLTDAGAKYLNEKRGQKLKAEVDDFAEKQAQKQVKANQAAAALTGSSNNNNNNNTEPISTDSTPAVKTFEDVKAAHDALLDEIQDNNSRGLLKDEEYYQKKADAFKRYAEEIQNLQGNMTDEEAAAAQKALEYSEWYQRGANGIIAENKELEEQERLLESISDAQIEYEDTLEYLNEQEQEGLLTSIDLNEQKLEAAKKYYDFLISNWANLTDVQKEELRQLQATINALERLNSIPTRGRTTEYRNYKAQQANAIVEEFDAGIITEDVAQQAIDAINADLESLQLKPLEININTDEAISGLEAFVSSADAILASINSVANVVGSIDAAYQAFHDMDEAMADAENGWERFMVGFNAGMQILNIFTTVLGTINTLMTTFNTIQAISTALKKKDAIASDEKAAADIAAAGAATTEAEANTAAAVSGAGKSVSWIPIVGAVLAVAAIAAVIGGIIAANNKAKFATGGIVPGSGIGDMDLVRVNGGEMILNGRQQKNLFNLIDQNRLPKTNTPSGDVVFRIQGDTLVGVIDNYNKKRSRA